MINVLIGDKNINFSVMLANYLNKRNSHVRIFNISYENEKIINSINSTDNIDIIILDYNMLNVLNSIKSKSKYFNSCIITSSKDISTYKLKNNFLIYTVISKNDTIESIISKINNLVRHKNVQKQDNNLKKKILNEINYLGFNLSYSGTKYLMQAVEYIASNQDKDLDTLEKKVYPVISKHCNNSIHNIVCSINRANDLMYCECELEKLQKYFYLAHDIKPKVKTVINTIVNKVSKDYNSPSTSI